MPDTIKMSYEEHTAIITIDNPPANTWTVANLNRLRDCVLELNENPEVVALIIASASNKFFSAGADLKLFEGASREQAREMAEAFGQAFETLTDFKGVSIAAINGYAMGGGLEVALACDFRIAEKQAVMALPEAGVGLLPCAGGTQNLTWLVGEAWAKLMILCGEKLDANSALAIGLVEDVVGRGKSLGAARELARKVTQQSPDAVMACKSLIQSNRSYSRPVYATERDMFVDLFSGSNQNEGVKAFLEKRKPEWKYKAERGLSS
ncbi:MAG: enoyl-CoA hydratase [Endozoicomonas sp.]